ncbi:hypothetical protein UNDKW_5834 [Undibacterium sp. KW1]|uniref:hypothetical protein n=1 Tax=Undibacterium sp. KW1 TaxID=2058624 RepID=UPI001331F9C1|nr:hypothetical protein [Undibacterium sp. KW1]BBB64107.1 hypothetical protein UNDKW_5834 [Undibacterium sp. KW1]
MIRSDAKLRPIFPGALYDDWIVSHFPTFQKENRRTQDTHVFIDFSSCEWVSPLPLLAIATELMSFSLPGRFIDINLGDGVSSDIGAAARARTRKFLLLHGFLDAFTSRKDLCVRFQFDPTDESGESGCWWETGANFTSLKEHIEKSKGDLLYGTTIVLTATTWELPSSRDKDLSAKIRMQVARLLRQADSALFKFKTEARKYRDVTLQRLNQTLLELVENAAEHGYLDSNTGYVGLYARVRQTESEVASASRRMEMIKSPLLGNLLLSEKQHQIEVFVVDVGRGLLADVAAWRDADSVIYSQQPLRHLGSQLFRRPLSRHDRSDIAVERQRGSSTGLMHLDRLLGHYNDVTRIVTGHEWIAGPHPRPKGFHADTISTGGYKAQPDAILGTFFHIGISSAEIPRMSEKWFASDEISNAHIRNSVLKKFSQLSKDATLFQLKNHVIDIRSELGLDSVHSKIIETAKEYSETIVRVNRVSEKNLIITMLFSWFEGIGKSTQNNSTLFLCDLGRFQAVDVVWVLENFLGKNSRFSLKNVPDDTKIFLVTEDLCCLQFSVHFKDIGNEKYKVSIDVASNQNELEDQLVYVLENLRLRDSETLWKRISELKDKNLANPIIVEDVLWDISASFILPYYLNFSVLVQDTEAARCVRRALRRLLALFPDANDHALDSLVGPSLHDAKKWLVRPIKETNSQVLVGSLSVSGTTLKRYRGAPKVHIAGVIDCIQAPYFDLNNNEGDVLHVAALLWDPLFIKSDRKKSPARFRRLGKTAFVEPIRGGYEAVAAVYDENLYKEIEFTNLIKLGHWSYGDRHSLLDINAELAIEQSGASESGAIPWISAQLTEICKSRPVVLVFPVDKLAYRLAHHVERRIERSINGHDGFSILPISFLPRFAGGMTRFAPLVFEAAKKLAKPVDKKVPLAVFLNFGFITNRTLRHVVRQLYDAGFDEVRAMGLLNRSSTPVLNIELKRDFETSGNMTIPQTYWRWNVPTLGTGNHCFLCSALPALGRLRRVVDEAHSDLLMPLERIGREWLPRDVADFWEEFGLSPLSLSHEFIAELEPIFARIEFENFPSNSTTLTARLIEHIRATGDTELPLKVVDKLLLINGSECATEVLSTILALAGGNFAASDLHDYVALLSESAIQLGAVPFVEDTIDRCARLLGLVSLVFSIQSKTCKLAVLTQLCEKLKVVKILDATELRIALLALTTDSDESNEVQDEFRKQCLEVHTTELLVRNYHSIRPTKGTARDSWDKLTQAFGRSGSHSQTSVFGKLVAELSRSLEPKKIYMYIDHIGSLLGQCDQSFVMDCLGIDLRLVINGTLKISDESKNINTTAANLLKSIHLTYEEAIHKLHNTLMRFGDRVSPLVCVLFYDMLKEQTTENGLILTKDIVFSKYALTCEWPTNVSGYFPLCQHVKTLFCEIFSNVAGKSILAPPPRCEPEFCDLNESAKGWLRFDMQREQVSRGITLILVTGVEKNKLISKYVPKVRGLDEFGVVVTSQIISSNDYQYFEVRVRIPSLADIILEKP